MQKADRDCHAGTNILVRMLSQASRIALIAAAVTGGAAYAQHDDAHAQLAQAAKEEVVAAPVVPAPVTGDEAAKEEVTDVIVVVGIRASLDRSLNMKREADSIVDGISSEDVGEFPDANIAEALQRVPGVAIDRSGGEGRFISIDGLGPDFANVLFNGRAIASQSSDRSFSFDTVASDLISDVLVYKSQGAEIKEGGIGGTVDVVTAKPFDFKGFRFAGNVSVNYEENSEKATPQASFIISDRFLDGRLGILASFVRQERRQKTYTTDNSGIIRNLFYDTEAYAYVADDRDEAWRLQDLTRLVVDEHRERTGGTVAVQLQASDTLKLSVDYLYSSFKVKTEINSASNYFYAVLDNARNVVDDNGTYTTFDHATDLNLTGYAYNLTKNVRPTTTQALGFNAIWGPSDRFSAKFDLSGSKALNNNRGRNQSHTLEILGQPGFLVRTDGNDIPYLDPQSNIVTVANEPLLRARRNRNGGNYINARNWETKLDMTWDPNDAVSVDFGGNYSNARKSNERWDTPLAVQRLYQNNATEQVIDFNSIVRGISRPGNVFGNPLLNGDMYLIDGDALRAWMADPVNIANRTRNATAGGLADFIANGRTWNAVETGDSFRITEAVTSGYFSLRMRTELGSMPLSVVAGVRVSNTDQISFGRTRILTDLFTQLGSNPGVLFKQFATDALTSVSVKQNYTNWLPTLNVKLKVSPDFILRAAASRSMTRPTLDALAPQINYGSTFIANRFATAGNPNLKPFVSTNLDASAEFYFGKSGSIALAYFHKDIENFIVQATQQEIIPTVSDPAYRTFLITRPYNAERAVVNGFNASFSYAFDFGFGVQANYTRVRSNATLDRSASGVSFALPGLSDTANVVAFFERGPFSARVAYNWRSEFLAELLYGETTEPQYFAPYNQIDARIGLKLGDNVRLTASAVNLTHQKLRSYGRYSNQFLDYNDYGRRFTMSMAVKF